MKQAKFTKKDFNKMFPDNDTCLEWLTNHIFPAEARFESTQGKGAWLRVILREGKKRQIREVGKTIGLPVVKIIRVRIGTLQLGGLKPREWRHLTPDEVAELKGQPLKTKPASEKTRSRLINDGEPRRPHRPSAKDRR